MNPGRFGAMTVAVIVALGFTSARAAAQIPVRPPRDTIPRRDTTVIIPIPARDTGQRADSTRRDSLRVGPDTTRTRRVFIWDPADSVMGALMQRSGYSVTRFQGKEVLLRASQHEMILRGKPSLVSRDSTLLAGDTIRYNDSTDVVVASGDTLVLRDPSQADDIVARTLMRYDVKSRTGIVRDVTTSVESGQVWVVHGDVGAFKGDTASDGSSVSAFYARGGSLTSCTDSIPHYHFATNELKFITKNVMVARPAILYIADIPVFWLPFVFQDMRTGRRSGIIAPRVGFSDIVRNRSSYRRTIDDFGYYFAISDYMDARVTMDWRSDAQSTTTDPGWIKLNGQLQYKIRDRFVNGTLGVSHHYLKNGTTNDQYSLRHDQDFSQRTHLSANINYVTNTTVQKNTTFNPYAALQTISSQLNFRSGRGPFSLNLGGTQQQYPGREEIRRTFPTLTLTSKPISAGEWLTWTPAFSLTASQDLHMDQPGDFGFRYIQRPGGGIDSVRLDRNSHDTSIRFDTPLEIFGFSWRNSVNVSDKVQDYPSRHIVYTDVNDTSSRTERVFKRTFVTDLNWETGFTLPNFSQGKWNLAPSVQIQKVDPRSGLWVRSERTGGRFVSQPLRPVATLAISPTLYHIFPGIGPLAAIRHSLSPTLSASYAPRSDVSDEFLAAYGDTRVGYLGGNPQRTLSLGLTSVFEGKLRVRSDTTSSLQPQGNKVKLLSLNFTTLSYDFERAKATKSTGLTNSSFDWSARSDLLPGLDFGVGYSLFQGDPFSDTATFKPYRTSIRGTLQLDPNSPIIRGLARLLGFGASTATGIGTQPSAPAGGAPASPANFVAGQPIAGSINRAMLALPKGRAWSWNLTYSSQRQRPPRGTGVVDQDPRTQCEQYRIDPVQYALCNQEFSATSTDGSLGTSTTRGGTFFRTPPQSNAQSSMNFHITDKWAAQWSTNYDFQLKKFASQIVSLSREMHDWDAVFAFTRAPNGNFAFNFFIALRAEPDIKWNYDVRDYPKGYTGPKR